MKKKGNQPTSTVAGVRHHSGDNKKPRLLQNNNRNHYYQQQQQQPHTQTSNQGRSATAGVKEAGGSAMVVGAAAGASGAPKGTSLMQRSINVRSKSGKTSDGGGATNAKLNTSMNAGGGYGPRKQVMSLSRRGVPGGGAQTSFNQGQPSLNGKHQFQSHRSQKSKKSSNHNGTKGKRGAAGRQQPPDRDSSSKSVR